MSASQQRLLLPPWLVSLLLPEHRLSDLSGLEGAPEVAQPPMGKPRSLQTSSCEVLGSARPPHSGQRGRPLHGPSTHVKVLGLQCPPTSRTITKENSSQHVWGPDYEPGTVRALHTHGLMVPTRDLPGAPPLPHCRRGKEAAALQHLAQPPPSVESGWRLGLNSDFSYPQIPAPSHQAPPFSPSHTDTHRGSSLRALRFTDTPPLPCKRSPAFFLDPSF